jgi:RHS repeat-associated protein
MVYGFDGELIAEYAAPNGVNPKPSAPTTEYAYRAGEMLIQADASDCKWMVSDHLGSPRIILGKSGSLADVRRRDFLPFGEDLGAGQFGRTTALGYEPSGTPSNPREKFAACERDAETGLDFAQARYYQNRLGKFTPPDEFTGGPTELLAEVAARNLTVRAELAEPPSLNKRQYCLNNWLKVRRSRRTSDGRAGPRRRAKSRGSSRRSEAKRQTKRQRRRTFPKGFRRRECRGERTGRGRRSARVPKT